MVKYFGILFYVVWEVSLVVVIFMVIVGYFWLNKMIKKVVVNGEIFEVCDDDFVIIECCCLYLIMGVILLIVVLFLLFMLYDVL